MAGVTIKHGTDIAMKETAPLPRSLNNTGPFGAVVVGNSDGDSLTVVVDTGLGNLLGTEQFFKIKVRLLGIDTPEMRSKALREKAVAAKARVEALCPKGSQVTLTNCGKDKYGRTDAKVFLSDGRNLGEILVEEGLAKPYSGQGDNPWEAKLGCTLIKRPAPEKSKFFKAGSPLVWDKRSDLESSMPKDIYDQKDIGSCVGNGVAACVEYLFLTSPGVKDFTPSRLFIYGQARLEDGNYDIDSGTSITQGVAVAKKYGCPEERIWPYLPEKFKTKPPFKVFRDAKRYQVLDCKALNGLDEIRARLTMGFPVVYGQMLFQSFMSNLVARTGIVPDPVAREKKIGGHCMVIIGHDDEKKLFKVRNSWGPGWGNRGHCFISYDYIKKYACDAWTILKVEE
jgi:endonuclease YncB( thermonuclease family)